MKFTLFSRTGGERRMRVLFVLTMTAAVIAGIILSRQLVETFSLRMDLTENKLYELGPRTRETAAALQSPVTITVLNSEEEYVVMLREILKKYAALSSAISLRFADPYENPLLMDHFARKGLSVGLNDIVVEGSFRERSFSIEDMYLMNPGKTEIRALNAEHQLSSALIYVNDQSVSKVGFSDGHNEQPSASLLKLFENNNFEVTRGSISRLLQEEPSIIVTASPSRDFREDEILLLESFLEGGGALMVFIGPALEPLENLEALLAKWGIILGDEVVAEREGYTGNNPVNIVPMYAPHEINRYFAENRIFLTMPSSRSLYMRPDPGSAYDVRAVLTSTPDSYGKKGYQFDTPEPEPGDAPGPFYLVLTSLKNVSADGDDRYAKMLVAGSRTIYADDLLGFSSYANADFLVQAINWLYDGETSIFIPARSVRPAPLNILSSRALLIGVLITIPLPLIILATGVAVIMRRRRIS
jgi:gliding motility-associatede transport system auxiliary component